MASDAWARVDAVLRDNLPLLAEEWPEDIPALVDAVLLAAGPSEDEARLARERDEARAEAERWKAKAERALQYETVDADVADRVAAERARYREALGDVAERAHAAAERDERLRDELLTVREVARAALSGGGGQ